MTETKKIAKPKPIRFDDTWHATEKRLADGVMQCHFVW